MIPHAAQFVQSISTKMSSDLGRVKFVPAPPKLTTQLMPPLTTLPATAPCQVNHATRHSEEQRMEIVKNVHLVQKSHHNKHPAGCVQLVSTTTSLARFVKIVSTTTLFVRSLPALPPKQPAQRHPFSKSYNSCRSGQSRRATTTQTFITLQR